MFGVVRKKWRVCDLVVCETGKVRKDNQDAYFVDAAKTVFCVADGMGGGSEGATACRFVREAFASVSETGALAVAAALSLILLILTW